MRRIPFVGLALVLVALCGCSVNLQHGAFDPVSKISGDIALREKAEDMSGKIGWGTFTVFMIPVARVTVNGQADAALSLQLKSALEHVGYTVALVPDAAQAGTSPYLDCHVNKFKFWNYTYLFPFVFNWGRVDMTLKLSTGSAGVLWEKRYVGKAMGFYSFEKTVNKALTRALNEMIRDLASREQAKP